MEHPEIIDQALQQFGHITGADVRLLPDKKEQADGIFELRHNGKTVLFLVEVKNEIRATDITMLTKQADKHRDAWLFICQYIPKPVKEELKKTRLNYLEAAGNCFIQKDGIFFFINDQPVTPFRRAKEGPLWKAAGLKFIFALLVRPELLNDTYRQMAAAAGIALGAIGPLLEQLKQEGFVREGKRGEELFLFIEHKQQLQNKWVELFPVVLKPKLKLGKFRFVDEKAYHFWKNLARKGFFWGGEAAAQLLTGYLKAGELTIYTRMPKVQIMKQLKLAPDPNGPVTLMEQFWDETALHTKETENNLVPPLIAYAELATSLDSRNRETADRIKELYLEADTRP